MQKRFCDICGKEVRADIGWVRMEFRMSLDANEPPTATADVCMDCVQEKEIPLRIWKQRKGVSDELVE